MYLSGTTHTLELVADAAPATTQPQYHISYNDHTSAGMTLPQSSVEGDLNGSTTITALSAPGASTNRQISYMTVYNADTATRIITVKKDISGTEYIIIKASLASGNTLQFSRENGWTIINQSTQNSHIITEFSANGTWTRPANLRAAFICCVGAGGGGGGGRRDAAGTNRFGGGGGGGGALSWGYFPVSALSATYTVTVGTGGTSGAAATADTTSGGNGGAGGDTFFGSLVIAKGGSAGGGGSTVAGSSGSGGVASTSTIAYGPFSLTGVTGSAGTTNSAGAVSSGFGGGSGCAGGAGGSGINTSNVSLATSAAGGSIYNNGVLVIGPATGTNGSNNIAKSLFFNTSLQPTIGPGTGGSGGNSVNLNGSNGGYGAGGGGGAGTLNGTTSGAGGTGGGGICVVLEIY